MLAVVVIVATTAGCGIVSGRVAILGDSITRLSSDSLHAALDDDYSVHIVGKPGARVDEMQAEATLLARGRPDKVIINLGTNDAIQGYPAASTRHNLEQLLDTFDAARCVVFVTIDEALEVYGSPRRAGARAVNVQIRQIADGRPDVKIVDWNRIVAEHGGILTLTIDGVHPNARGQKLLAEADLEALASC